MPEKSKAGRGPYPPEVRERAVRMVFDHQGEYPSQWKAIESIAAKLAINHETLRQWVRRAETDAGERPGLTTDERARMKELREGELRAAPGQRDLEGGLGFLRGGARPATAEIVAFIDEHRDRFGVEPICRVLSEHGCQDRPEHLLGGQEAPTVGPLRARRVAEGRDPPGLGRQPRGLWGRQGLDPAQPRGHPRGPLHRRAPDA